MQHSEQELGTIAVLLDRMNKQRIPRLLEMKGRVDQGECLGPMDIDFLEEAFRDASQNRQIAEKFPEHRDLFGKIASLYQEVTAKALENEKKRVK